MSCLKRNYEDLEKKMELAETRLGSSKMNKIKTYFSFRKVIFTKRKCFCYREIYFYFFYIF